MSGIWKYNTDRNAWEFFSDDHAVFIFSAPISTAVLAACEPKNLMEDGLSDLALDKEGALLRLIMHDGEPFLCRCSHGTTMSEEDEIAAIKFADEHNLFELSKDGILELGME